MDEVKGTWNHSIATGEDVNIEIQLKRKSDNMYRWHLSRALPIRDEEGAITMWVGVAIDIHDQKTKEESKDEFIGIASHELKTPLTTAKALVQLLQMNLSGRTPSDETLREENLLYAQKAGVSIDRLNDLIGDAFGNCCFFDQLPDLCTGFSNAFPVICFYKDQLIQQCIKRLAIPDNLFVCLRGNAKSSRHVYTLYPQ